MVGLVAGCTTPQSTRPQAPGDTNPEAVAQAPATQPAQPATSSSAYASNTVVGQKARELELDTDRLEQATADHISAHSEVTAERAQLSSEYFTQVAQINSRLEAGTTPGNPELVAEWQNARRALSSLDAAAARLTDISSKFTDDTAQATYLSQTVRAAFTLRGAVDADHAVLRSVAGRVASTSAGLEQTLGQVLDELNRQNEMLAVEHRNLTTLARAIEVGQLLGSNLGLRAGPLPGWTSQPLPTPPAAAGAPARLHRSGVPVGKPATEDGTKPPRSRHHGKRLTTHNNAATATPAPDTSAPSGTADGAATPDNPPPAPAPPAATPSHRRTGHSHAVHHVPAAAIKGKPLIVIPVATTDDSYQRQLYSAVSAALESSPTVKFLVVAASPGNHNRGQAVLDAAKAQHQAEDVARSLVAFGLPQNRVLTVATSAPATAQGEIRVFAKPE
ncbi:MAG TPA: hypothetical protein VM689_19540 [Aliidongia sp.]|nr:hypothetical protein [Aliidongia sp.]